MSVTVPNSNWSVWGAAAVSPYVDVVIIVPTTTGSHLYIVDPSNISSLTFNLRAFSSSSVLTGAPTPGTGSLEIIDYDQIYNPTLNDSLTSGLSMIIRLGTVTWAQDSSGEWVKSVTSRTPYGRYSTQEWSYDTDTHTATLSFISYLSDFLSYDSRDVMPLPSTGVPVTDILSQFSSLWQHGDTSDTHLQTVSEYIDDSLVVDTLRRSFYEDSITETLNQLAQATLLNIYPTMSGTPIIFSGPDGWYDTGVTLTDDNVESFSVEQTSAAQYDSVSVTVHVPKLVQNTQLATFSDYMLEIGEVLPLSIGKVASVDYLQVKNASSTIGEYTWDVTSVTYTAGNTLDGSYDRLSEDGVYADELTVYGTVVSSTERTVTNVSGQATYEIDSDYVQSVEQANKILDLYTKFLSESVQIVTVNCVGSPGFWLGGRIHVTSDLYSIDDDFVIIGLSVTYTGALSTTLTLQKLIGA